MSRPVQTGDTIAVWFSCGAASAIAAQETLKRYGGACRVRVINNPVMEEGWDNRRFLADIETWLGIKIEIATHPDYPMASAAGVWENRKFMCGTKGAPCTDWLKKRARQHWEANNHHDHLVMGFHAGEEERHRTFALTERANILPILIDRGITKQECADRIAAAGIELPVAYRLGLPNANCLGCVKATSPTYWNHIRSVAPEVFAARAEQSRRIGAKLVRVNDERIFLDELSPNAKGRPLKEIKMPECGIFCEERSFA